MRKILRNIEETPEEKIQRLEKENSALKVALAETVEKQVNDKIELQLALAEFIENTSKGGV
ncbi:MAG: hypothetical protein VB130_13465 [Clostridium sp.]|nr:hypothetical protein [Clostridium sp.]